MLRLSLVQMMENPTQTCLINERNLLVHLSSGSRITQASGITWSRGLCNVLCTQFISKSQFCPPLCVGFVLRLPFQNQDGCSSIMPSILPSSNSVEVWILFFLRRLANVFSCLLGSDWVRCPSQLVDQRIGYTNWFSPWNRRNQHSSLQIIVEERGMVSMEI